MTSSPSSDTGSAATPRKPQDGPWRGLISKLPKAAAGRSHGRAADTAGDARPLPVAAPGIGWGRVAATARTRCGIFWRWMSGLESPARPVV
jgi:hypothetical protein